MPLSFESLVSGSSEPMSLFVQRTLARLVLSYAPMIDFLALLEKTPKSIASFGSGSCAHEVFLSAAFQKSKVHCHDVTNKYIPAYLLPYFEKSRTNLRFQELDLEQDNVSKYRETFDMVFSIQTLEHIKNYRVFLELLSSSVKPGGYLYLDAPYYHMDDSREDPGELQAARDRQWAENEHYHLGFSPHKLIKDPLLSGFSVIQSGYYGYHKGDQQILRAFRDERFGRIKSDRAFGEALCHVMQRTLAVWDDGKSLDDRGYFKKPAVAFRLLLQKQVPT